MCTTDESKWDFCTEWEEVGRLYRLFRLALKLENRAITMTTWFPLIDTADKLYRRAQTAKWERRAYAAFDSYNDRRSLLTKGV